MISIRPEIPSDIKNIRKINELAFKQPDEADLVDKLRLSCKELVSLVAEIDDITVGHILFSPVSIDTPAGNIKGIGLGPMAVLPEFQRQGVGSRLINTGLDELAKIDCPFVVVLGHPNYYPRFGFRPSIEFGLDCQWDVPDNVFMIQIFNNKAMKNIKGTVRYHPEFDELT